MIADSADYSHSAVSKRIHGKLTGREQCGRRRCTSIRDERMVKRGQMKNFCQLHKEWTEAGPQSGVSFLVSSRS